MFGASRGGGVKPQSVSPLLAALIIAAFFTQATAQEFAPPNFPFVDSNDGPSPDAAGSSELLPEETLPLPVTTGEGRPREPIPLPPVESVGLEHRLSLMEAQRLAMEYHPALREARARVRAARGNWLQVGLRPNPEIAYSASEIGDEGRAGQQGGYFSQEFVTAGKLEKNRAIASRSIGAAEQRAETARLQVLTTVRMNYFEMLAAERSVVLANQLVAIANEAVKVSEGRLEAMDIPRVTLLQSEVERESTMLLEVQSTERRDAAWRRLAAAIGVSDPQPVSLDDALSQPLPEFHWETIRTRLLTESPELAELQMQVDRARARVRRESVEKVPNVTVQAGTQFDNATEDQIANVQVSVPIPVFDRNQGAIAEACGELAAAQAALQQRELILEQRLAAELRDYTTARERTIRYADKVLPTARETLQMMNAGYQSGELDYLQVLTIQQAYTQQSISYLRDLETAWKKWALIDGLLVGPVSE